MRAGPIITKRFNNTSEYEALHGPSTFLELQVPKFRELERTIQMDAGNMITSILKREIRQYRSIMLRYVSAENIEDYPQDKTNSLAPATINLMLLVICSQVFISED